MKLKRKAVPVATLVVLLALMGGLEAQQRQIPDELPAAAQPPAEVREIRERERRAGPDPVRQVTREHVLRALEQLEPGSTRPENLRRREGSALPGAVRPSQEAREVEQRERAARGARQPPAPTRGRLLEVIRGQPGGPEMLEEARRRGAPISARARTSRLSRLLARINPLRIREARAQSSFSSVTLTPSNPSSREPYAVLWFFGGTITSCCTNHRVTLSYASQSFANSNVAHLRRGPYAYLEVRVPSRGWYVISFRALQGYSHAELWHLGSARVVSKWDHRTSQVQWTWEDYPAVVLLSAGTHSFYFFNTNGWAEVSQVSMFAL